MGKENTAAIIGGEGAMGKMTDTLFQNIGFQTVVSDITRPDLPTLREAVNQSGVIFLSVLPVDEIPKIINDVEDLILPEHVVLDNASPKDPVVDSLKRLDYLGASVCSTHPLIRPEKEWGGQKALLMNIGSNPERARSLAEKLYKAAGMETVFIDLDKHDELMAVIQFIPHLIMRAIEKAIGSNTLRDVQIVTPNFQKFLSSFESVVSQTPQTSENIIRSLKSTKEGKLFVMRMMEAFEDLLED